ncbi:MAG: hypothetical protein A2W27_11030 [Deltaproteobacteria bacterium RBG_16_44_11]|nr:MAG: hypothetical protein A2W27_11030 [Deltaproteobacteria bacterium RBG_16_44_11]
MKTNKKNEYGCRSNDEILADAREILESGGEEDRDNLALNIFIGLKIVRLTHEKRKQEMEITPLNIIKGGLYKQPKTINNKNITDKFKVLRGNQN